MFQALRCMFLATLLLCLMIRPAPSLSEELLDQEHTHYRQQVERIRKALEGKDTQKSESESLITDAHRSMKWIFEEPRAAETEERRLRKRISKEFLDLNLPVLIHAVPPRSFLSEKTTSFSSIILNFETGEVLVSVSVPYFQDNGLRKAKNEAVFLSILLLQDGIMEIPVDGEHTVSQSVSGQVEKPGGLMEHYISTAGLSSRNLSLTINGLAAGGGIVTAHINVPMPLHIGGNLSLDIARKSYSPWESEVPEKNFLRKAPYTGLILDARAFSLKPFRDPVLISEQNRSLFVPDAGRPSSSWPYGWAGWGDSLSSVALTRRVGNNPLLIRPEEILNHHVIVLTTKDSERVGQSFRTTKLIFSGHIAILIRPEAPAVRPELSPATEVHP